MTSTLDTSRSVLYRKQIANIVGCMRSLVSEKLLSPLRSTASLAQVKESFARMQDNAYLRCSDLDAAYSIEEEDTATSATIDSLTELVHLKNDARKMMQGESA